MQFGRESARLVVRRAAAPVHARDHCCLHNALQMAAAHARRGHLWGASTQIQIASGPNRATNACSCVPMEKYTRVRKANSDAPPPEENEVRGQQGCSVARLNHVH
jgi:hypothetical protein